MPPAKPATIAPWRGWVFEGSGDLPRCSQRDDGLATAEWREPTSSDRLPIHRSESPTGYSSAGCSPAEPASASPVTDNSSSIPIQRGNQMRCSTPLRRCSPSRAPRARRQRGVSSLLCTPGDISILRRHSARRRFSSPSWAPPASPMFEASWTQAFGRLDRRSYPRFRGAGRVPTARAGQHQGRRHQGLPLRAAGQSNLRQDGGALRYRDPAGTAPSATRQGEGLSRGADHRAMAARSSAPPSLLQSGRTECRDRELLPAQ